MPFATTPDGTRLYFECHGTGTPLLLLAGQASDHREWDGVRADFAAHHRVIVLDKLGIERSHVYGVSMGATTPGNAHGVAREATITQAMQRGDWASLRHTLVSPEWSRSHPDFEQRMAAMDASPGPAFARGLQYQASEGHDSWQALPDITAATLVIHGSQDEVNPSPNGAVLAGRLHSAELELINGARHRHVEEFRAVASPLVLKFLSRLPLPA